MDGQGQTALLTTWALEVQTDIEQSYTQCGALTASGYLSGVSLFSRARGGDREMCRPLQSRRDHPLTLSFTR